MDSRTLRPAGPIDLRSNRGHFVFTIKTDVLTGESFGRQLSATYGALAGGVIIPLAKPLFSLHLSQSPSVAIWLKPFRHKYQIT